MVNAPLENIRLLVRLALHDHEGAVRCLRARTAPLGTLFEFAAARALSAVLFEAIQASPLRESFPAESVATLQLKYAEQQARTREYIAELERVTEHFAAAGQDVLLLKGPYLAARFYGNIYGREFVDLDLLVPKSDRERAFRLLGEVGYAPRSRTLCGSRVTCYFVHGFDFTNGSSHIDLHWRLSRHPSFRVDERAIWSGRRRYEVGGHWYDVLPDEYEVVFAVLSLLRDFERGRPKMKNIVDLLRILAQLDTQLEWNAFLEARRTEGTFGPAVNILGLCLDIADAHDLVPHLDRALARAARHRVTARFSGSSLLLAPAPFGIGNKLWCARVYDASLVTWLLWWTLSLPFRVAVHQRTLTPSRVRPTARSLSDA